ncbi:MAG TPA: hypothetical protein VMW69_06725 [Spirochaetia bacterium]|nr:hypothetical protein [Spirochaetia bacterium]
MSEARKAIAIGRAALLIVFLAVKVAPAPAQSAAAPTPPVVPSAGSGFSTLAAFTLPATFYVGDRVELRIRLKVQTGTVLQPPTAMPTDQWIRIDSISVTETKDYSVVHIFFVSYAPGVRPFPTIRLGGIELIGIAVTTASLVAEGRTRLTDPKGQLLLPGSTLILGIVIALVIGLPLTGILLYRRFRLKLVELIENRRARRPWRQLKRALDALELERPPRNPRRFYITLIDEIRRYLTLKFGSDFRTVTGREFVSATRSTAVDGDAASGLARIVSFGELVKFAGQSASEDTLSSDINQIRQIVTAVEESVERETRARRIRKASKAREGPK